MGQRQSTKEWSLLYPQNDSRLCFKKYLFAPLLLNSVNIEKTVA